MTAAPSLKGSARVLGGLCGGVWRGWMYVLVEARGTRREKMNRLAVLYSGEEIL